MPCMALEPLFHTGPLTGPSGQTRGRIASEESVCSGSYWYRLAKVSTLQGHDVSVRMLPVLTKRRKARAHVEFRIQFVVFGIYVSLHQQDAQRGQVECQYGIGAQKTIYCRVFWDSSGLLIGNYNSATIIQKPYSLVYIHNMAIYIKFLNSSPEFHNASGMGPRHEQEALEPNMREVTTSAFGSVLP